MIEPEPPGVGSVRASSAAQTAYPPVRDDDIDLAGVDPLKIEEIRRRVRTVRSYLALLTPTDEDRRRHAKSLALSVNQFLALVRAWKEHGRAVAISGAGATRGKPRPKSPRNLPPESKEAARAVLRTLGADVPHVDAVKAVEARCTALGLKAPSRSTIWNMVMAIRRDVGQTTSARGEVIVSRCLAKLPVQECGTMVFPWIMLAVDSCDGSVLCACMGDENLLPKAARSAFEVAPPGRGLVVDRKLAVLIGEPDLREYRAVEPSAARTATAKALGRGFGTIEIIYQPSRAGSPERMLRSRRDSALSPTDARRLVMQQLTLHNAARGGVQPVVSWST